jgi:hypothetical protein
MLMPVVMNCRAEVNASTSDVHLDHSPFQFGRIAVFTLWGVQLQWMSKQYTLSAQKSSEDELSLTEARCKLTMTDCTPARNLSFCLRSRSSAIFLD